MRVRIGESQRHTPSDLYRLEFGGESAERDTAVGNLLALDCSPYGSLDTLSASR